MFMGVLKFVLYHINISGKYYVWSECNDTFLIRISLNFVRENILYSYLKNVSIFICAIDWGTSSCWETTKSQWTQIKMFTCVLRGYDSSSLVLEIPILSHLLPEVTWVRSFSLINTCRSTWNFISENSDFN